MLWVFVKRSVDVCHLVLLILLLSVLGANTKVDLDTEYFNTRIEMFQEETKKVIANNLTYVEGRINRLQEQQDGYQVSSHQRIKLLEGRVKALEAENKGLKSQSKSISNVVISNSGNNIVSK